MMDIIRFGEHPNRPEIVEVVGRLGMLDGMRLGQLALLYADTAQVAAARDLALSPAVPQLAELFTVLDYLATVQQHATQMCAMPPELHAMLGADALVRAFSGVRDAIAGAYARPLLDELDYTALMRPWRLSAL